MILLSSLSYGFMVNMWYTFNSKVLNMYLSTYVNCISTPPAIGYWAPFNQEHMNAVFKKGQHTFNLTEILHPASGTVSHPYSTPAFTYGASRQSPPLSPKTSGLAPLQALCTTGVSAFQARSKETERREIPPHSSSQLKFGISRILSEDFGKKKKKKGKYLYL